MHTTNYYNTFIETAEDCPVERAEVPPLRGNKKSVANLQFEMLYDNPYKYSSDDLLFEVHAIRNEIPPANLKEERERFFSKGQACLRASPLTKRYGWGVHSDEKGKIAVYASNSKDYQNFVSDPSVKKVKAMRSSRK